MSRFYLSVLIAVGFAIPAAGQDAGRPLSAVDWLSNSIATPPALGPVDPQPAPPTPGQLPPTVDVISLDAPVADSAGTVMPSTLGLSGDFWGGTLAGDAATRIAALPTDLPPTGSMLLRDLMMLKVAPPVDARIDDSLFIARVDKLLAIGHLDDALALMELAPTTNDGEFFRRRFDISLLRGTESEGCDALEANPDLQATFPARIFCLARNGEWDVAALTLGTAESLGFLSPVEDALLLKFLDPELFEDDPVPPAPTPPSPLLYRLYDAIGERLATEPLPIAFAEADLRPTVGWKSRLRAAERLTGATAMPVDRFFAILFEREPAASGGIWDRAEALQNADLALRRRQGVEETLARGWRAANEAGIAAAVAPLWADRLFGVSLEGKSRDAAFEIGLLAGRRDLAARYVGSGPDDTALLSILNGTPSPTGASDPLSRAVRRGLVALQPSPRYQFEIETQGPGMALLTALRLTSEGRAGDPDAVGDALTIFRALGLQDTAERIAVELLLEDRTV